MAPGPARGAGRVVRPCCPAARLADRATAPGRAVGRFAAIGLVLLLSGLPAGVALAAQVPVPGDAGFVRESTGSMPVPFLYLGAKAALAAPGHLLTLLAVALPLASLPSVAALATALGMVLLGHGIGLGLGAVAGSALADAGGALAGAASGVAVAGLAFANLWRIRRPSWPRPVLAAMALLPGLPLGLVSAASFAALPASAEGRGANAAAHALGGTLGLALAAAALLLAVLAWRRPLAVGAYPANVALMTAGLVLAGHDLAALLG